MDIKKLPFSDQLSSARKKVVSGFCLGLVASFIAVSVVLFNVSFKTPFLNPVFQGFNSLSSHKSSLNLSWPFSFSSSNNTSFSSSFHGASLSNSSLVLNQTLDLNVSESGKDSNFNDVDGKGVILGNTLVGNFSNSVKNRSFSGEKGRFGVNSSEIGRDANFLNANDKGMVLGKIAQGNFSKPMGNISIVEGGMVKSEAIEKNVGGQNANVTSNGVTNRVPEDGKIGNLTYSAKNVESRDEGKKVSDVNIGGISPEGNNGTISSRESRFAVANSSLHGECDIYHGRWVRDDTKPYYPPGSCPYIDRDFDCHLNGRPDDGYVKWKWQPYGCNIPSLNATDFLERLRGKNLVFVGDSLNRNMWESLVCILRQSVHDKKRVYEISGRTEFKKKGFYAFRFEDYNCSVDFVGSPFLVRELSHNGKNGSYETLRLDLMDPTTLMYQDADVLIFNTGHWWTHEKTSKGENYYQEGNYVHPRLEVLEAYKRALATWARWVEKNIDADRTQIIFRGYSVTHFRGGPWDSGGKCHNEMEPITNDAHLAKYPSKMKAFEHVLKDIKTPVIYLNISRLTDYRKDAHPSIYRKEYKPAELIAGDDHVEDCSHWCLPGVPDTWNELLYASLLRSQRGSWRN